MMKKKGLIKQKQNIITFRGELCQVNIPDTNFKISNSRLIYFIKYQKYI